MPTTQNQTTNASDVYHRFMGIEVEVSNQRMSYEDVANAMTNAVAEHDPNHSIHRMETVRNWTVKTEHCGFEITSPMFTSRLEDLTTIRRVIKGLRLQVAGRRAINRSCGLHVHFDIRDLDNRAVKDMVKLFWVFEGVLFKLQPPSRGNNHFCARVRNIVRAEDWERFDPANLYDHSNVGHMLTSHTSALSLQDLHFANAIECRHSASTIREGKLIGWIKVLLTMIEIAKANDLSAMPLQPIDSVPEFCEFIMSNQVQLPWLNAQRERTCAWVQERVMELAASSENRGPQQHSDDMPQSPRAASDEENDGFDDDDDPENDNIG